jgi:hypothetical protein
MHISDEALIAYLEKRANRKRYSLEGGAVYLFRLERSPNPTERMPYQIVFYSSRPSAWEKDHEIAACFAIECLDRYNGGAKTPDGFIAKTGARSASRRGRYFLEVLRDLEGELIRGGGHLPTGEASQ